MSPGPHTTPLPALVADYLGTLTTASESTRRQRRWALHDLISHSPTVVAPLSADLVRQWLSAVAEGPSGKASVAGLRARHTSAKALGRHAHEHGHLSHAQLLMLEEVCTLHRTGRAPVRGRSAVDRLLTSAAGPCPYGVHPDVWVRFGAHVHLLASTGATESVLASLTRSSVNLAARTVQLAPDRDPVTLDSRCVAILSSWLQHRAEVVQMLEGTDPGQLWIRVRPAGDRRGGPVRPAGMPISVRGLRLAYQSTRDILAVHDPDLADVEIRAVRAHHQHPAPGHATDPAEPPALVPAG